MLIFYWNNRYTVLKVHPNNFFAGGTPHYLPITFLLDVQYFQLVIFFLISYPVVLKTVQNLHFLLQESPTHKISCGMIHPTDQELKTLPWNLFWRETTQNNFFVEFQYSFFLNPTEHDGWYWYCLLLLIPNTNDQWRYWYGKILTYW